MNLLLELGKIVTICFNNGPVIIRQMQNFSKFHEVNTFVSVIYSSNHINF